MFSLNKPNIYFSFQQTSGDMTTLFYRNIWAFPGSIQLTVPQPHCFTISLFSQSKVESNFQQENGIKKEKVGTKSSCWLSLMEDFSLLLWDPSHVALARTWSHGHTELQGRLGNVMFILCSKLKIILLGRRGERKQRNNEYSLLMKLGRKNPMYRLMKE